MIMKIFKSAFFIIAALAFLFFLAACSDNDKEEEKETPIISTTEKETTGATTTSADANTADSGLVNPDTYVILDNDDTTINGAGASFENSVLTITQSGTYLIKGTLSDGKIYIDCPDEEKKVKLYLNGVSVSCSTDAPLFVENSPKETVLVLTSGTVNSFSDTAREVSADENADYATAAIYAKDDLQIEGEGTLNVTGNFNKGIYSKNDIDIHGGVINITSVDDGIRGKESVEIVAGKINITAGGDGIRTNESLEEGKGNISISGGVIDIVSDLDCIQSVKDISITGGVFNLTANAGATQAVNSNNGMDAMNPMGGSGAPKGPGKPGGDRGGKGGMFGMYGGGYRPGDSSAFEVQSEDTPSAKGIKAEGNMTLSGGSFTVSSTDDCLHAVNMDISGGRFNLKSDDDGIHADETVNIEDADINVSYSYEGIEGTVINIDGGEIKIKSVDDGFNAAGENTTGTDPMKADYSCEINVTDGYIHINADGDGVDSNGNVNQSGGTIIVFGPQNGANGALDYGGTYTVSGGTLLALGAQGMAQSVTGDGTEVLAFTYSGQADTLNAITDEEGECLVGFNSPKGFGTVVFVSDEVENDEVYSVYSGGSFDKEGKDGVWLDADYTKGTLEGSLS